MYPHRITTDPTNHISRNHVGSGVPDHNPFEENNYGAKPQPE